MRIYWMKLKTKKMKLTKIEKEQYDLFQKSKKKLTLTGGRTNSWFWRNGELSYAQFQKLNRTEKDAYIKQLLKIPKNNRSTNDDYILKFNGPEETSKVNNFFSIDEIHSTEIDENIEANIDEILDEYLDLTKINSTEIDANIPDEIELIKNIPNLSKQEIKELIDVYYAGDYPNWEFDLRQTKLDNFINNTNSLYEYTNYIIGLLTTYKSL